MAKDGNLHHVEDGAEDDRRGKLAGDYASIWLTILDSMRISKRWEWVSRKARTSTRIGVRSSFSFMRRELRYHPASPRRR